MRFMKPLSAFALFASLASQAQAIEPWQGERHLVATTADFPFYSKIFLEGERGRVTTKNGSSVVKTTYSDGTLTFDIQNEEALSVVSYPFKQNPETGISEQVMARTTTKKIIIVGSERKASVKFVKEVCYDFSSTNVAVYQQCEMINQKLDKPILITETLPARSLKIVPGDKIVIPGQYDHLYIQLNLDGSVTKLIDKPKMQVSDHSLVDTSNIESWSQENNVLNLLFKDGGRATYQAIQNFEGVERVVGTFLKSNSEIALFGGFVVDHSDMKFDDVSSASGDYLVSLGGTTTMGTHLIYEFDQDGFGGFDYLYASLEPHRTLWKWDLEDGDIRAEQYRFLDPHGSSGPINSRKELESCIVSLDTDEPNCVLFAHRTHRILQAEGNRIIILRSLYKWDEGENGQNTISHLQSAPFVLYKK